MNSITRIIITAFSLSASCIAELAFDDGNYHIIDYTTTEAVSVDRDSPGMQTHVELVDGGWLNQGHSIYVRNQGRLTVSGGMMDWSVWASDDSEITITGGYFGRGINTDSSKPVTISGGSMYSVVASGTMSYVDFSGGTVRGLFEVRNGATAVISGGDLGGSLGNGIRLFQNSTLTISGGSILTEILSGFYSTDTALITLEGSDFVVNGTLVEAGTSLKSISRIGTISGKLANGDILSTTYEINGNSDIQVIPEPPHINSLDKDGNCTVAFAGSNTHWSLEWSMDLEKEWKPSAVWNESITENTNTFSIPFTEEYMGFPENAFFRVISSSEEIQPTPNTAMLASDTNDWGEVSGTVTFTQVNFTNDPPVVTNPVKRTLCFFEKTSSAIGSAPMYWSALSPFAGSAESSTNGDFSIRLPAGDYSVFAIEPSTYSLWAGAWDEDGNIWPVHVESNQNTVIQFNIAPF